MEGISDLTLERARLALQGIRSEESDSFVSKLADISLFLLNNPRNSEQVPLEFLDEVKSELEKAFDELIDYGAKRDGDLRTKVFYVFFFLAQINFASYFHKTTFANTDVELRQFIFANLGEFVGEERLRVEYLFSGLPRHLLLAYGRKTIISFQTEVQSALAPLESENAKAARALGQLNGFTERAEKLADLVKGHSEKLNFIGLSRGFESLILETNSALKWPVILLFVVAAILIAVPVGTLAASFFISEKGVQWWQISAPALAIELVLVYLFRVLLLRYQSLKAQLLQLKLRFSLCAFVESYAEFAGRIRKGPEDKVLDKFEALVFAGITPDPQNVPSQFDGLEQLVNLVKSVRSSGPG